MLPIDGICRRGLICCSSGATRTPIVAPPFGPYWPGLRQRPHPVAALRLRRRRSADRTQGRPAERHPVRLRLRPPGPPDDSARQQRHPDRDLYLRRHRQPHQPAARRHHHQLRLPRQQPSPEFGGRCRGGETRTPTVPQLPDIQIRLFWL